MRRRCQELARIKRSQQGLRRFGRDFLEIANVPAICAGSHQNYVLVRRILCIEQLASIEGLDLYLGLVEKLHGSPIRGIKDRLQMVAVIHDPNVHSRFASARRFSA